MKTTDAPLKFTIPVNNLRDVVSKVIGAVEAQGERPVLSNLLFTASDGNLFVSATDLRIGVVHQVSGATIELEGSGLVNAARLFQILKLHKNVDAVVSLNPRGGCSFKAPGGSYRISGDDVRDFPTIHQPENEPCVLVTAASLVRLIDQTSFAVTVDAGRHLTNGILFELSVDRLRLVTTDNSRIAISQADIKNPDLTFEAVAPAANVRALLKIIGKDQGTDVLVGMSNNKLFFRLPRATITLVTLAGRFPPYKEVLGIKLGKSIDVENKQFSELLDRASVFEDATTVFKFSNGVLDLQSTSKATGEVSASMPIAYTGEETRIGFNPKFFRDILPTLSNDKCRITFEDRFRAGMLKEVAVKDSAEVESQDLVYLVMPYGIPSDELED